MPRSPQARAADAARRAEQARKALKAMHGYWSEYAAMPSLSEITARMGAHAKSWAHTCVQRLVESGHVERMPNGRLIPGDKFFDEI